MPKAQIYVEVTYGRGIVFAAQDTEAVVGILARAAFAHAANDLENCISEGPVRVIRLMDVQKEAEKPVEPPATEEESVEF